MEGIQVSTEVVGSQNQISVIKVGGFIDTTTSSEVERALNSLLKQDRFKVIIDLGNVDYISSAGWGIFISEIKSIRESNGDLKLIRMIPDVYEIFELLEFHHILDVYDSVEEAVAKFEEVEPKKEPASVGQSAAKAQPLLGSSEEKDEFSRPDVTKRVTSEEPARQREKTESPQNERKEQVPLSMRSLEDKVKIIVSKNPQLGAYKINKILNSPEFGFTKVGWFGVRSLLGRMNLNSRKNRSKFARNFSGS